MYKGKQELYVETPMETLPVYIKGGAIIPMQSVVQSAKEMPFDTMYLHVYNGTANNTFTYYEDAGDGYEYSSGKYYKRNIIFNASSREITLTDVDGNYISKFKNIKLMLHGFNNATFKVNESSVKSTNEIIEMIPGVSQFDPIGKSIEGKKSTVSSLNIKNTSTKILVSW